MILRALGLVHANPKTSVRGEPRLVFLLGAACFESAGNLEDQDHDEIPGRPDWRLVTIFKEGEEREEGGVTAR